MTVSFLSVNLKKCEMTVLITELLSEENVLKTTVVTQEVTY